MNEEKLFARVDDIESALSDYVPESDEDSYLVFRSSGILYAISTDYVQEIFSSVDITKIPMMPEYVSGVINLRGQIVPIVDFRLLLGRFPDELEPCAIILDIGGTQIGILVDTVDQMVDISRSAILPVPAQNEHRTVNGMCTVAGISNTVMIVDATALVEDLDGHVMM